MEETVFKSDDLLVMNLINYFITEKNYNPMIIHGLMSKIVREMEVVQKIRIVM